MLPWPKSCNGLVMIVPAELLLSDLCVDAALPQFPGRRQCARMHHDPAGPAPWIRAMVGSDTVAPLPTSVHDLYRLQDGLSLTSITSIVIPVRQPVLNDRARSWGTSKGRGGPFLARPRSRFSKLHSFRRLSNCV